MKRKLHKTNNLTQRFQLFCIREPYPIQHSELITSSMHEESSRDIIYDRLIGRKLYARLTNLEKLFVVKK